MRRRSRLLAFTVGALASALAACSVITGLNADYTREDNDNSGDADATVMGNEGSPPGPDATSPPDANSDAGTFCDQYGDAANVGFCWDFESTGGSATAGFVISDDMPNGNLALEPDSGDHTFALRATVTSPKVSSQAYVQQQVGDGAAGTNFEDWNDHVVEFDFVIYGNSVNVVTIASLGYETPASKLLVTGLAAYWDMVATTQIDISSPPGNPGGSQVAAPPGQWMHAKIHLTRTASTVPFTTHSFVGRRGETLVDVTTDMPPFDSGTGPTELLFGAYFTSVSNDAGAKVSVGIDNILYTHAR